MNRMESKINYNQTTIPPRRPYALASHDDQIQRGRRLIPNSDGHLPGTLPNHLPRNHPERLPMCFVGTSMGNWHKMPQSQSYRGVAPYKYSHIRVEPYITEDNSISEAMAYCRNTAEAMVWYDYNEEMSSRDNNQDDQEQGARGGTDFL